MTLTVHQFVPNFAAGDAIGGHVRLTERALREAGIRSEIFYDEAQAAVRGLGRHYSTFDADRDGDGWRAWILFHLSTGSPMASWVLESGIPFGVYFHNITPPLFFDRWEPGAAENLRRGLGEMRRMATGARFALAQSRFSERELVEAGFSPTDVAPVLVDFTDYDGAPNDRMLARLRREADGAPRWLFVSRVAPNKCHHDVIAAFAAYREVFEPRARLTLVGGRTSNVYYRSIEVLAEELGVDDAVEMTDTISFAEVLACFHASDVFVCLSEHEGYGVTLLEAMHLGLPVVAYASSAIPEVVGDAALLLDDKDPMLVASAVHRVLTDPAVRDDLLEAGRSRVDELSLKHTSARLVEVIRRCIAEEAARD